MGTLHFCRDGILRRTFERYERATRTHHDALVPLRAYERVIDRDVFLKSLHSQIIFEDGLTVGEMMENLAPWADKMTGVGVLDFPAFLAEMRRDPVDRVKDVEKITLVYYASLNTSLGFGAPNKLTIEEGWDMQALLTPAGREDYDGATSIAIDYTPMSEWKHLVIDIDPEGCFSDETAGSLEQGYAGIDRPLTDGSHPLVQTQQDNQGQVFRHRVAIEAPTPTFFDCLIRAFFWEVGFSFSPAQRDDQFEKIVTSIEELDSGKVKVIPLEDALLDMSVSEEAEAEETDRQEDAEFLEATRLLELITAACRALSLPAPRQE